MLIQLDMNATLPRLACERLDRKVEQCTGSIQQPSSLPIHVIETDEELSRRAYLVLIYTPIGKVHRFVLLPFREGSGTTDILADSNAEG